MGKIILVLSSLAFAAFLTNGNLAVTKYLGHGGSIWNANDSSSQTSEAGFTSTYSVNFNGTSSTLQIDPSFNQSWESPESWVYWIKLNSGLSGKSIWDSYTGGANKGTQHYIDTGAIQFWMYAANNTWLQANAPAYTADTWMHVAITYNGNKTVSGVKIYYNGVSQSITNARDNLSEDNRAETSVYVGSQAGSSSFFGGRIHTLAVYTVELSQTQVTAAYNGGVPVDLSTIEAYGDCLGWYQMGNYTGDSTSTIINSKSPGTYDATGTDITIVADAP